jgi:hypothetical protein
VADTAGRQMINNDTSITPQTGGNSACMTVELYVIQPKTQPSRATEMLDMYALVLLECLAVGGRRDGEASRSR